MTGAEYALLAVTVLVASSLQASIGFGLGMLAAPVIALVDSSLLPATIIMMATVVTLLVAIRERSALELRGTSWAIGGRIPGTFAGAALVAHLPERVLALVLAGTVLIGVLLASTGWSPRRTARTMFTAGVASGLMGTATSIGGPPMALVWRGAEGPGLRGNMAAFFLFGSVFSIIALSFAGAVHEHAIKTSVLLLPAVLGGYVLSRMTGRFLNRVVLGRLALAVSSLGAILLIGNQLFWV